MKTTEGDGWVEVEYSKEELLEKGEKLSADTLGVSFVCACYLVIECGLYHGTIFETEIRNIRWLLNN
jgi:hypothetical protein